MVYGTNFPTKIAYGPLHWAEEVIGWSNIADIAEMYASKLALKDLLCLLQLEMWKMVEAYLSIVHMK